MNVLIETLYSSVALLTGPGCFPPAENEAVLVAFDEKPTPAVAVPIVAGEVVHEVPSKASVALVALPVSPPKNIDAV